VGRDPNEITPFAGKWCVIREDAAEAKKVLDRIAERHGMTSPPEPFIGGPDEIAAKIAAYWKVGMKGFIVAFADPFDTESIERLANEVRPRLKELTSEAATPVSG
jgi:alkanesulfonate monooxygenase SsuD/methylene tetrahydromethanopterin reductase-like flavin-dependent oxidoreductase (luciferase family)